MARQRAAAAAASNESLARVPSAGKSIRALSALALLLLSSAPVAAADAPPSPRSDEEILGPPPPRFRIEQMRIRTTAYEQNGYGYQSQAARLPYLPGSQRLIVLEPQLEVVASQGERFRHRFWVPVDVVTSASADALDKTRPPDMLTSASRRNIAGTADWQGTLKVDDVTDASLGAGLHLEPQFRSWHAGIGGVRKLDDAQTTLAGNLLGVFDFFDRFRVDGERNGRAQRSTTTGTVSLTHVLTPITVVHANYSMTMQVGELGNTWNTVPLTTSRRGPEILPDTRLRQALVGRASQWLPWDGALRLYARVYGDDWGIRALTAETQLLQRFTPSFYARGFYRVHAQTGASFFTTVALPGTSLRVADSDLAMLDSHSVGGSVVVDVPAGEPFHALHFELGYERYWRNNDLQVNVVTWETGAVF